MSTLYDLANICRNEVRLIGSISEFCLESYEKNDVLVVKYKGVVKCNNAFITIKSTLTNYDATIVDFAKQFNNDVIGKKVYLIGRLNASNGINVSYLTLTNHNEADCLQGTVVGVVLEDNKLLVADNEYHQILNVTTNKAQDTLCEIALVANPLVVDESNMIVSDGSPPIILQECKFMGQVNRDLVNQALEEHSIYIEATRGQ